MNNIEGKKNRMGYHQKSIMLLTGGMKEDLAATKTKRATKRAEGSLAQHEHSESISIIPVSFYKFSPPKSSTSNDKS